ncbi:hypothetical protein E5288_WYG009815 [Bos mutus]|uniref:acylphosphatase n=1 Tax=Bos mutus TaxID=72004 RepID=A0A6B0R1Y5_9CETA|nr:hypothetical protein [Bos mutus]
MVKIKAAERLTLEVNGFYGKEVKVTHVFIFSGKFECTICIILELFLIIQRAFYRGNLLPSKIGTNHLFLQANCLKMGFVNTGQKSWLSKVGSPSSRIDRTNFSNEKTISKLEYSSFNIRY